MATLLLYLLAGFLGITMLLITSLLVNYKQQQASFWERICFGAWSVLGFSLTALLIGLRILDWYSYG